MKSPTWALTEEETGALLRRIARADEKRSGMKLTPRQTTYIALALEWQIKKAEAAPWRGHMINQRNAEELN